MKKTSYDPINGLENIYLEDSFILDIKQLPSQLTISLDAVLTESHPLYQSPSAEDHHCYRKAHLKFSNISELQWANKDLMPSTDANGEKDYGSIDKLFYEDGSYYLYGDIGQIKLTTEDVLFEFDESH